MATVGVKGLTLHVIHEMHYHLVSPTMTHHYYVSLIALKS